MAPRSHLQANQRQANQRRARQRTRCQSTRTAVANSGAASNNANNAVLLDWQRWSIVAAVVMFALWLMWPVVLLIALVGGGYWLWHQRHQQQQQEARYEARLNSQFYELLHQRQGRVSALELAMHTRISGTKARQYLHRQAQSFGGFFERTVHGDVIYIFNLAAMYSGSPAMTPAEVAWAYAERERLQHMRASTYTQHLRDLRERGQMRSHLSTASDASKANAPKMIAPAFENALDVLSARAALSTSQRPSAAPSSTDQSSADQQREGMADVDTTNVVRGRASGAPHQVITIDVLAVNE
ncbi:MAG: hypothetical protein AAFU53_04165 [Cyanobacteria bacterium J06632_3]